MKKTWWDTLSKEDIDGWFKDALGKIDSPSRDCVRDFIKNNFGKQKFSLLDMGCGLAVEYAGYSQYGLTQNMEYTGLDGSERLLSYCREKYPDVKFLYGDINSTKLDSASSDIVLCRHILEHQKYYHDVVKEAFRISKDIVIIVLFKALSDKDDLIQYIDSDNIEDRGFLVHNNVYNKEKFFQFISDNFKYKLIKDNIFANEQVIIFKRDE